MTTDLLVLFDELTWFGCRESIPLLARFNQVALEMFLCSRHTLLLSQKVTILLLVTSSEQFMTLMATSGPVIFRAFLNKARLGIYTSNM